MQYTFNLYYGKIVTAHLTINGRLHEMFKLEYVGEVGNENEWLQFTNVKTKEHHLCPRKEFPKSVFKMGRENLCVINYE